MRWRPFTWFLLSVACLIGSLYFWRMGNEWESRKRAAASPTNAVRAEAKPQETVESTSTATLLPFVATPASGAVAAATEGDLRIKYRVSNTTRRVGELAHSPQAILLANALIDSTQPLNLAIPDSLKAKGDPGSYLVQARGEIDDYFREQLRGAGAAVVSYFPNNAFLVRADAAVARQLAGMPRVQSVIPWEPYYKLDWRLLVSVLDDKPLPPDAVLNVVVFADARDSAEEALSQAGAMLVGEDRSPFGPVLRVKPAPRTLTAIAGLPGVQSVGLASQRKPANDLSRARIGVASDSQTNINYLNLTGDKVLVSVVDTGVDAQHPDLAGRVFANDPAALTDTNGHGTFEAGIIGSSGNSSTSVSNASGSILPAVPGQFRGMAPGVKIFSQLAMQLSDFALQEEAARTNALVSNQGWNYSSSDYDIAAASYDAAVRDALPDTTGSQPLAIVFPAGNAGNGNDEGTQGSVGSILSPGTSKNAITVGAIEQPRTITNEVQTIDPVTGTTNSTTWWEKKTDSDNQVASFSSRGNVGVQVEGEFGRFKPDVVAPGTFVVSTTRKAAWDQKAYYNPTNYHQNTFIDVVRRAEIIGYPISLPYNTVGPVQFSVSAINPDVDLPIYYKRLGGFPTPIDYDLLGTNDLVVQPGDYLPVPSLRFYGIGNPTNRSVRFQVSTRYATTNDNGNYFQVLSNMNNGLGPNYRYESGTSMSAADVSGMLALIGDFFTNRLHTSFPSPALMKAMVINGARGVSDTYNLEVTKERNLQGWGLANLTNSLPMGLTNGVGIRGGSAPMLVLDQSATNALATGERRTFNVTVSTNGIAQPLRVTLVWTDPPGNPAAGIKLVNDLDLVVTNLTSGLVYFGNDIPEGSVFTFPWETNGPPILDVVNNVENVYLQSPVDSSYSITVIGRRVNVNAVPQHTNNVVQDFALVVSSGDGEIADALSMSPPSLTSRATNEPYLTVVTNAFEANNQLAGATNIQGALLLNQHVGANSPLVSGRTEPLGADTTWGSAGTNGVILLGVTNQWHFYVMTNEFGFTNAAFATFLPPTLSLPRMGPTNYQNPDEATRVEADIDLYVSKDPNLLTLDPDVVIGADKSLGRFGSEVLAYTNSQKNDIYYIGVHSQDQQAAEYAFFGVFSLQPFSTSDSNGVQHVRGINVPSPIPEGPPNRPGGVSVVGIALQPTTVRKVVVTNTISHENMQNLFGTVSHQQKAAVLNNHSCIDDNGSCLTNVVITYDDENPLPRSNYQQGLPINTDGPGSLMGFMGEPAQGVWLMTEVDNSLGSTGRVQSVWWRIEPELAGDGTVLDIEPNSFGFLSVDVPPEATNMTIIVQNESPTPLPLQLYVRRGELPTLTQSDYAWPLPASFGPFTNSISKASVPPLQGGRYFIGIYNPNMVSQRVRVFVRFDLDVNGIVPLEFMSQGPQPILDDAITYSSLFVTNTHRIIRAEVGVAIRHPRISDLAITLLSPAGKRILLYENRGGPDAADLGDVTTTTNFFGQQRAGDFNANTNVLSPVPTSGILIIDYNFHDIADTLAVNYEGTNVATFTGAKNAGTFTVPYGPGASTSLQIVMNPGNNPNPNTVWEYTPRVVSVAGSYFIFSENTNSAKLPVKFGISSLNAGTNLPISGLETIAPGDFVAPVAVGEGWQAESNEVSVVGDAATAKDGSRFLALGAGTLARTLTVNPGQRYRLNFAYRGPGITSWWRGESNTLDSVDGNPGFFIGGASYTTGEVARAFSFDGVNRFMSVPDSPSLSVVGSISLDAWIFPVDDRLAHIISKWGDSGDQITNRSFSLQTVPGRALRFAISDAAHQADTAFQNFDTAPGVFTLGAWHHVAGTYDAGTGTRRLYVDGAPVASRTDPPVALLDSNARLGIGAQAASSTLATNFFNGRIDEPSLYHRAIAAAEVNGIFLASTNGKADPAVPAPSNLAEARVSLSGVPDSLVFGDNQIWNKFAGIFKPTGNTVSLRISGLKPGLLLDSFNLDQLPEQQFVLPEESLDALIGDSPFGQWTLEVWDTRASQIGSSNVVPQIASWEMRFILENDEFTVMPLTNRIAVTNTLPACQIARYSVDVPDWAGLAENRLLFATPPGVNVWFSTNGPPTGTNPGDLLLITPGPSTGGSFTMTTNSPPRLIPGSRYFLSVENPCSSGTNVTYAIEVDFYPGLVTLTNMVPYPSTNSGVAGPFDFYRFVVSTNSARAQFEINFPTGDLTLLARRGLPPPRLFAFDYLSQNPGTNDELIVVLTNSTPVALGPGDWYLTVVNQSGTSVAYSVLASAWPVTGRPFAITNYDMSTNSLCLTWPSLPGVHYYVQGVQALSKTNWYNVSPTLTAGPAEYSMTYCISLPSPFQFFRVAEGLALFGVPEPPPVLTVKAVTNGFLLQWIGSVTAHYEPQWTRSIAPPMWTSFTNVVTSTNGWFSFLDDGTQSGGLNGPKFYRILQVP